MKLLTLLYVFCLFYVLIPGNIIKLPIKTSKMNTIIIHGLLFTVILSCTYNLVENVKLTEGMHDGTEHDEGPRDKIYEDEEKQEQQLEKDINENLNEMSHEKDGKKHHKEHHKEHHGKDHKKEPKAPTEPSVPVDPVLRKNPMEMNPF